MNVIDFIKNRHSDIQELIKFNELRKGCYFYLNPFNYFFYRKNSLVFSENTFYMVDGIFLVQFLNLFIFGRGCKIKRQSFDMTSIAPKVLTYCEDNRKRVFFAGGSAEEIERFITVVRDSYKEILITSFCNGYESVERIKQKVKVSKPDVVILGLGNIKQEKVANEMHIEFPAVYFTCGAFISQVGGLGKKDYFPKAMDNLNLRWLYRFYKEPRVMKRVFVYYPMFILAFLRDLYGTKQK